MAGFRIRTWCDQENKFQSIDFPTFREAYSYASERGIELYRIRPNDNAVQIRGVSEAARKRLSKAGVEFISGGIGAGNTPDRVHVPRGLEKKALKIIGKRAKVEQYRLHPELPHTVL